MSLLNKIKDDRYNGDTKLLRFNYYFSQVPVSQGPIEGKIGFQEEQWESCNRTNPFNMKVKGTVLEAKLCICPGAAVMWERS